MEVEVYSRSKDVVPKEAVILTLGDGMAQSLYRQRVLCTHIDISVFCRYRVSCDQHSFDQLIWVTFHYGTVHERSRVTLVSVTYHVTGGLLLVQHLFPFLSCREASASAASQAGSVNLIHYSLSVHLYCLDKRREASCCYVLIQRFRIDVSAVLQHDPGLFVKERDIHGMYIRLFPAPVEQSLHRTAVLHGLLHDLCTVLCLYLYILVIIGLDPHQGTVFAQPLAAGLQCPDMGQVFLHLYTGIVNPFQQPGKLIIYLLCS